MRLIQVEIENARESAFECTLRFGFRLELQVDGIADSRV